MVTMVLVCEKMAATSVIIKAIRPTVIINSMRVNPLWPLILIVFIYYFPAIITTKTWIGGGSSSLYFFL